MKKNRKGFTLIELMIVVAIIGILAAIAIPNFLRYQLRTKAGERRINLEAIFKAEEALRQSERQMSSTIPPGQYIPVATVPGLNTVNPSKIPWNADDLARASAIDWIVQGSTYAKYNVAVNANNNVNVALSACAWSDIDGDTIVAGDALFNPQLNSANGGVITAPVAAPCTTNTGLHVNTYTHGTDPMGRPIALSADSVF